MKNINELDNNIMIGIEKYLDKTESQGEIDVLEKELIDVRKEMDGYLKELD